MKFVLVCPPNLQQEAEGYAAGLLAGHDYDEDEIEVKPDAACKPGHFLLVDADYFERHLT